MSVIIKIAHLQVVCLAIFVVGCLFACLYPRYNLRNHSSADSNQKYEFHGQCDREGIEVSTPKNFRIVYSPAKGVRVFEDGLWSLDLFMAAEPSVVRRRLRLEDSGQGQPVHMQTVLEEMDADLAALDEGTGAAAAAAAATPVEVETRDRWHSEVSGM